jgi:hypothetical protein
MIHVQEYGTVSIRDDNARKKKEEQCCRETMAVVCITLIGCFCLYIVLLIIVIVINRDELFGVRELDGSG